MKVLVIPEDPSLAQYILKPVVERIFSDLGRIPRITILSNPRLRGVHEALDSAILIEIVKTYSMSDLFLARGPATVSRDRGIEGTNRGVARRPTLRRTHEGSHRPAFV